MLVYFYISGILMLCLATLRIKTMLAENLYPSEPLMDETPKYAEETPESYKNLHSPPLTKHSLSLLSSYLDKYGLGSCGPRGFLGTFSSHIHLELELERYYKMFCILYSSYASVASSALISVCGKFVYLSTNASSELKRCTDRCPHRVVDFTRTPEAEIEPVKSGWLLIDSHEFTADGVVANDLQRLFQIAKKNCLRVLVVDTLFPFSNHESYPENADLVIGSIEHSFGLPGGFCCGCRSLVENQRTAGPGYCFSAASPPALVGLVVQRMQKRDFGRLLANVSSLEAKGWTAHGFYCEKQGHVVTANEWLDENETCALAEAALLVPYSVY